MDDTIVSPYISMYCTGHCYAFPALQQNFMYSSGNDNFDVYMCYTSCKIGYVHCTMCISAVYLHIASQEIDSNFLYSMCFCCPIPKVWDFVTLM